MSGLATETIDDWRESGREVAGREDVSALPVSAWYNRVGEDVHVPVTGSETPCTGDSYDLDGARLSLRSGQGRSTPPEGRITTDLRNGPAVYPTRGKGLIDGLSSPATLTTIAFGLTLLFTSTPVCSQSALSDIPEYREFPVVGSRVAVWVGLTSMGGSFCWFLAFTLQNAAYVKALGQVELLLSLLASLGFFKEDVTRREIIGMALLVLSILALILAL